MNDAAMLASLKIDLGITATAYDARLQELLGFAKDAIIAEGATDLDPSASAEDAQMVIMYAGWLWRRRDTQDGMPRMVRWALNNRIFGQVMRGEATT